MLRLINRPLRRLFLILAILSCTAAGQAQPPELPPQWPWRGVSMGFPEATPADLQRYHAQLGINMVRLQIKSRRHAEKTGISGELAFASGLQWADAMLDECKRLGITAVVNVSHFPLDAKKPGHNTRAFWQDNAGHAGVVAVAERLARHFHGRGNELAAYDILSEPVMKDGNKSLAPAGWPALLADINSTIRRHDPDRWLVVATAPWGGTEGYADFTPPAGKRLIWGVHLYMPHRFTHQGIRNKESHWQYPGRIGWRYWDKNTLEDTLAPLKKFQQQHGGIVWVGEFSAVRWAKGDERYLQDMATIFDNLGWGWAYFNASGWHGWNPDYNSRYPGNDSASSTWQNDYQGDSSVRWQTLRALFGASQ